MLLQTRLKNQGLQTRLKNLSAGQLATRLEAVDDDDVLQPGLNLGLVNIVRERGRRQQ